MDDAGAFILDNQRHSRVRFPAGLSAAPRYSCGGLQNGLEGVRYRNRIAKILTYFSYFHLGGLLSDSNRCVVSVWGALRGAVGLALAMIINEKAVTGREVVGGLMSERHCSTRSTSIAAIHRTLYHTPTLMSSVRCRPIL